MGAYRMVMLIRYHRKGWDHELIAVVEESKARGLELCRSGDIEFFDVDEPFYLEWRKWINGERKTQPSRKHAGKYDERFVLDRDEDEEC